MSAAWQCRPYRVGDEQGIIDLYREIFKLELTVDYWRWAFQRSPDGPTVLALIEKDQRVVGHYAVTPKKCWFDGRLLTTGYAGGTMLSPEARNVKTFIEMANLAYSMCRERDIAWLYCCPNAIALPVRLKLLRWRQLPDIVEWSGPRPRGEQTVGDVHVWDRMPDLLAFSESSAVATAIQTERSAAWLKWRYFDRPGGEYVLHTIDDGREIAGFAVTKRYVRDGVPYGHIIDWHLQPSAVVRGAELLASVWRQLAGWEAERVSCWADGDSEWQKLLRSAGLIPEGRASHLCYYDLSEAHEHLLSNRNAWKIVMADCDVY